MNSVEKVPHVSEVIQKLREISPLSIRSGNMRDVSKSVRTLRNNGDLSATRADPVHSDVGKVHSTATMHTALVNESDATSSSVGSHAKVSADECALEKDDEIPSVVLRSWAGESPDHSQEGFETLVRALEARYCISIRKLPSFSEWPKDSIEFYMREHDDPFLESLQVLD